VQKAAIQMLCLGNTLEAYHSEVGKVMESELIGLGLLDPAAVQSQPKDKPFYKNYFPHGTSHHLGLDVHDYGDKFRLFEAGMVLTCEPGIYIRDEGIGIRIENDILITEAGPEDLTADIPREAEEIEDIMNSQTPKHPNT
jgi:Xaa-Pro aminopeptidase